MLRQQSNTAEHTCEQESCDGVQWLNRCVCSSVSGTCTFRSQLPCPPPRQCRDASTSGLRPSRPGSVLCSKRLSVCWCISGSAPTNESWQRRIIDSEQMLFLGRIPETRPVFRLARTLEGARSSACRRYLGSALTHVSAPEEK